MYSYRYNKSNFHGMWNNKYAISIETEEKKTRGKQKGNSFYFSIFSTVNHLFLDFGYYYTFVTTRFIFTSYISELILFDTWGLEGYPNEQKKYYHCSH